MGKPANIFKTPKSKATPGPTPTPTPRAVPPEYDISSARDRFDLSREGWTKEEIQAAYRKYMQNRMAGEE